MKKRDVKLPQGGVLDLQYTDKFISIVREWAKLDPDEKVTDYHIRNYLYGAMKNAIDKDNNDSG